MSGDTMSIPYNEARKILHRATPSQVMPDADVIDNVIATAVSERQQPARNPDSFSVLDPITDLGDQVAGNICTTNDFDADPANPSDCTTYKTPRFAYKARF
jgi:hypothetical protein